MIFTSSFIKKMPTEANDRKSVLVAEVTQRAAKVLNVFCQQHWLQRSAVNGYAGLTAFQEIID
jgi:hypothetical protein